MHLSGRDKRLRYRCYSFLVLTPNGPGLVSTSVESGLHHDVACGLRRPRLRRPSQNQDIKCSTAQTVSRWSESSSTESEKPVLLVSVDDVLGTRARRSALHNVRAPHSPRPRRTAPSLRRGQPNSALPSNAAPTAFSKPLWWRARPKPPFNI